MGRLGRLGMEPAERYERTVAGELIHIDVKNLLTTVDAGAARSPLLGAFVHPVVFDEKVNEHAEIRGHNDKDDP